MSTSYLKKLKEIETKAYSTSGKKKKASRSVLDRMQAKIDETYDGGIDVDAVRAWFTNSEEAFKGIGDYYKANEGKWVPDYGVGFTDSIAKLKADGDSVGWFLRSHKNDFEDYDSLYKGYSDYRSYLDDVEKQMTSMREFYSQFDTEDVYNAWKNQQEANQAILGAEDFEEYYQKGKNLDDDNNDFIMEIFGRPVGEANYIEHYRNYYKDAPFGAESYGGGVISKNASKALAMTEDEVKIYDYYLAKEGKKKAQEYLDSLEETLNQRVAKGIYETIGENKFLELSFAATAGLDQFMSGIGNIDNLIKGAESDATSAIQYASSMVREDMDGAGGVAYDLISATGNMLPSILVGSLTGGVGGALTLGTSAAGNGYAEMRNLGYDEWQSRGYGLLVGASETVLQYVLGGIGKLGGKLSGNAVSKLISKVDNALARTAIQLGGNMASEGIEEAIQTVIDPAIKALMTGESFESPEWDEVLYSALLGALSAGVLEGVPTIAQATVNSKQASKIYSSDPQSLVREALDIDPDNAHAQRMQERLDNGKNVSGYQLNRLVEANERAMYDQDISFIQSAVAKRLATLGETGDINALSAALAKKAAGQKLSLSEKNLVKNSKYGQRVANELNPENIRSGQYSSDWAEQIGTNRINSDEYSGFASKSENVSEAATDTKQGENVPTVAQSAIPKTETSPATENTTKKENSTEGVFGVSESGKTTYNGNEVKVRRISSIKDGEITLVLDNGETANARDLEFGNEKEALLYETVVDMDVDKANDLVHAYNVSRSSASSGPQSVSEYLLGFNEAYRYGKHGIPYEALARDGKHSKNLLEVQRQIAYDRGKTDAAKETEKAEKARTSKRADNGKSKSPKTYKDEVHISEIKGTKVYKSLSQLQRRSIEGLTAFYKALGIDVYLFESPTDEKGNRTGKNGYYNPEDNSVHIDIYAGVDGKGAMIFTTGHELSHYIRNNAPAKFKAFADIIFEQLEGKGVSVEELITKKIETLKKNGRITSEMTDDAAYDLAYEEVVADACEAMLADGEVFTKVAELIKAKDRTLWQTIKDFFTNLAAKIKSAYAKLEPDSIEGRYVADMLDTAEELKTLWAEALVEASGVHKESVENNDIRYSFRESKSGMANDMLSPYDAELTKFIELRGDYIVDSFEKLEKVVNLAFDNPDKKATAYFGIINAKTLEKIKNSIPNLPQTSKDILFKNGKDYSIATTFDSIRHIVDDKNLDRADVVNYLDRLADTIVEFDSVTFDYYTDAFKQKNSGLLFKKKFTDGTLMSFSLISNKKRSIVLQSLYMDSADYQKKKSAKTLLMQNSLSHTPEVRAGRTSNKSLPQISDSVNPSDENLYSDRNPDAISNRTLLANALESVVQNDIERNKLNEYKKKISLIESEQAKLARLNGQIKELSFAKGKRDTEAIKKLQLEATQTANRINIYDRQLLNLESTAALKGVLNREKQAAYKRAEREGKEALERYREKAVQTQKEILARASESRKKGIENRHKTEMRHKIKGVVNELNTLLLKPTAKKHIKEELRKEVADALSAINLDTVGAEERVARYNEMIAKSNDADVIAELTKVRDKIQKQGDNLKEKFATLRDAYEKIKASEDIELSLAYQEVIQNSIKNVSDKVGNTSIRNMTLEQLEMVYDLFSMIKHTIRDANKSFKAKRGETIMQMAEAVNDQVRAVGGQPYKRSVVSVTAQKMGWTFLKPLVAFRTIGSDTLTNLYKELRNGEDTFYNDVSDAQAFIQNQYKKHGYKSWNMKKTKTFTAKSGKTFDLTLEQMMTLYAYSRRTQAHKHIIEGGIVFEDALVVQKNKVGIPIKYEVTTKDAFNLSEETFTEIANSLSEEQRAFVDEMQEYLSDTMGEKGNEVSMELLGVKLFKEKFYLPIKSSQEYMNFKAEEAGEVKLRSPAFSKETVQHANNPIVLHNFTDLWAEHINDMSMYHSFVLALEDFTKVYNYKTKTGADVETTSIKAALDTAYPGAIRYINKFLKDMNGGVRSETVGWADKLTSLAKKGAVLGSGSVAIQQPSAIMRAMATVNPRFFVAVPQGKHGELWAEIKKYAPIAGIKEMGRFDVGMGQGTVDWIQSNKTVMEKIEDVLSKAPGLMDELAWVSIWNAVKRETLNKHNDLSPKSEEFFKIVGERFTEVISLTQVYDSVFSRSDIMRNKSWIAKALTAFMAEPSTTMNMIWDAWVQAKRSGGSKGYVKAATTTGGAIISSIILNSALKSIILAMKDDDEDESYIEKYIEHFFGDLKDSLNPLTLVPLLKDIVSIFKGYDVERMDMSLVSDLKNAIDAFDSENKTVYEKWSGLIGAISALFGIPVKNVERDVRGLINTFFGEAEDTTAAGIINAMEEGWTGESKSNAQQLYEAILNGDFEQVERVKGRFKDQSAINSAIRKALRENDPRIKEAAEAKYDEDIAEYTTIINKIIAEGNFEQKDIVAAINAEVSELKGPSETTTTDKEIGIYKVDDYYITALNGDTKTASAVRNELIKEKLAEGYLQVEAEAMVASSFSAKVKEVYMGGDLTRGKAKSLLISYGGKNDHEAETLLKECDFELKHDIPWSDRVRAYRLGKLTKSTLISAVMDIEGKSRGDAELYIKFLDLEKANPTADITSSDANSYFKYAEPAGIKVNVFLDYKNSTRNIVSDKDKKGNSISGSRKAKVMAVIDSLPITSRQKDALYLTEGWAEGKLHEAPWH